MSGEEKKVIFTDWHFIFDTFIDKLVAINWDSYEASTYQILAFK